MKTLRLIGMTLLMVMLAVNFTACSDDEEEQTIIDQANLIGKWQSTWEKVHKVENGKDIMDIMVSCFIDNTQILFEAYNDVA